MMLIRQIGTLAGEAAQRGDDRAADVLGEAHDLLVRDTAIVERDSRRRRTDNERQARHRSATSRDVTLETVTPDGFPHTPFLNPKADKTTARATEYEEAVLLCTDLLRGQMGDALFPDADAFVRRRPFATWKAWLKEMLALLTGGQATAADVAQVCRDDEALTRKIDTPKGLRIFVASAVEERLHPTAPARSNGKSPTAEAQRIVTAIRELITRRQQPGQSAVTFIPKEKVTAMGERIRRAYDQVGGSHRFVSTTGENISFLVRDFAAALNG